MPCFFEKFLNHLEDATDIHYYIDQWHSSVTAESIFEYLGMSEAQYEIFIRFPEQVEQLRFDKGK